MSDAPTPDPSIPKAFEVIGEHYRLVRKLGEGAFGVVYEARHELLGQNFAVKILKPELCEDENLRERFLDEARALIRFSHENVVQLRHVGEHAGRLYLVMDLVEGEPLNDLLRREGALGEPRSVSYTVQVLGGLEAAHAAGIVHRDLKPGNLIVDKKPDGSERIRILDFGLSKLSSVDGTQGAHRSVTGAIIGTLAYMSPEQLSGEREIDARSDVFAIGLILHEMLDGSHPYPGESGIVVAAKLLREPVPDLDPKHASQLSDGTRAALRTALERDRDARFSSAFTFAQALQGKGPPSDTSRVTTIQEAKESLARSEAAQARKQQAAAAKKKKGRLVTALVLALAAAAVGAFLLVGNGNDEPEGNGKAVAEQPPALEATPPPEDVAPPEDVVPPDDLTPPAQPADAPARAVGLEARGQWAQARAAWQEKLDADPLDVDALRRVAMAGLEEADVKARHDHVDAALATLDDVIALLTKQYSEVYEPASQADRVKTQRPMGFALTHRGEAHTARAQWLGVQGDEAGKAAALADASEDLELAWQFLQRDGVHYWDFLLRRAEFHRQSGDPKKYLEDLALATPTEGEAQIPTHLWVARFTGLRREAERLLILGRRAGVPGGRGPAGRPRGPAVKARVKAASVAAEALRVVKAGASWSRQRKEPFTRADWIEAARVIVVNDMAMPRDADRASLQGLMRYYLEQAREAPRPLWASGEQATACLKPLDAELAVLDAKVAMKKGDDAEAARQSGEALARAREGVEMMEQVAEQGGRLPGGFPYLMLGYVLQSQGQTQDALEVIGRGRDAARKNPE